MTVGIFLVGTALAAPPPASMIVLSDAETLSGWGRGAALTNDCQEGRHAIAWVPKPVGAVAFLPFALDDNQREAVAHGKTIAFWYKFEGAGVKSLHLKVVAHPLAGGWEAVYALPVPPSGEWRRANVPLQEFDAQWGDRPRTNGGSLEFRVETRPDATARLFLDDLQLAPLPAGTPVNTGEPVSWAPAVLLIQTNKPLELPPHPRLLFSAADIPAMQQRAAQTEWGKAYADGLRARGNEWLKTAIELPPRGGTYWHAYACAKDGASLKTESPTRHVCPVCGKVYTGQPYDDFVFNGRHSKLADGARDLGLLYQLAGDKRYAAKAREILLAYAARYRSYPLHNTAGEPKTGGGRVACQTLDESIWLIAMAQGADAVWDTLSSAEIEMLKTQLFYPAAVDVIQKHRMGIHNIQCWKNSAVGLTGLLFGDGALVSDAVDSPHGCQAQLAQGVGRDGAWYEGSWSYHFYTMDALHHLTEAMLRCGVNLYGDSYRKMFLAPLDLAQPDGTLPVFNDCSPTKVTGNPNYEIALARYKNDNFALPLAGSNRRTQQAFVNGVQMLPAAATAPQASRNFPDSGYAILRAGAGEDATWLCLKYGPHGGGHGHPDKNTFVLYGAHQVLVCDAGTGKYGVPLQAAWYKSTLAHNTLVVDEDSQHPATGACLDFQTHAAWSGSLTDAGSAFRMSGVTFRRAAFLVGTNLAVFLDLVNTGDGRTRKLDLACHLRGKWIALPSGGRGALPDKPGYSCLRDMQAIKGGAGMTLTAVAPTGSVTTAIAFAPTAETTATFWLGTGVGANTEDRVPIVIARRESASTAFAWAIGLDAAHGAPVMEPVPVFAHGSSTPRPAHEAAAVQVTMEGRTCLVIANPDGGCVDAGGWSGTNKLAVVPLPDRK